MDSRHKTCLDQSELSLKSCIMNSRMKLALKCQLHQLWKYFAFKRNSYVKLWKESDMSLVHKSEGKKMQLVIKMMNHLPVKKRMMTMKMNKVLLQKWNHSDKKKVQEVRPLEKVKQWHQSHLIITVFPPGSLHPPVPFKSTLYSKFSLPGSHFIFQTPLSKLKIHTKFKIYFISIIMSKSSPLHCQKQIQNIKKCSFKPKKKEKPL